MSKTRQEIFDTAYRGLASQGFEASTDESEDTCLYRDGRGRKCAIGWCIPDKAYRPAWEEVGIDALSPTGERLRAAAGVSYGDVFFAKQLQDAHDCTFSADSRKAAFERFAEENGLTIPEVSP